MEIDWDAFSSLIFGVIVLIMAISGKPAVLSQGKTLLNFKKWMWIIGVLLILTSIIQFLNISF